jgi:mRNA interferase MazF
MVKIKIYIPAKGDIVWLNFSSQVGHEQAGQRPALCISPLSYNQKVGLGIFCPITSQIKGYPFEVKLPDEIKISGVILSDQIKSLDWRKREAKYICRLPVKQLNQVLTKIKLLVFNP